MECPCGSSKSFVDCCDVFISGQGFANTPEELMRSRYSAYTLANVDYIAKTMKAPASDRFIADEARTWAKQMTWIKLEVLASNVENTKGHVEFMAHYSNNNKRYVLHEISEFHLDNGQWYYVDGRIPEKRGLSQQTTKISRNDSCPCGSNKKFKKCCGAII